MYIFLILLMLISRNTWLRHYHKSSDELLLSTWNYNEKELLFAMLFWLARDTVYITLNINLYRSFVSAAESSPFDRN